MAPKKKSSKTKINLAEETGRKNKLQIAAETARERQEQNNARNAQASIRDRMVKIGRGNQQSGRGRSGSR
jgi:hypothetical protein